MDIFQFFKFLAKKFNRSFILFLIIITIIWVEYSFFDGNNEGPSNLVKNPKLINNNVKNNNKEYNSDSIISNRQNVGKNIGLVGFPIISNLIKTKDTSSFVPKSNSRLVSLFQVGMGTNPQFINVIPDITSNEFVVTNQFCQRQLSCNNRKNVFNSGLSKTFRPSIGQNNGPVKYLDGSSISGSIGNDFITFSQSKSKFQADILLAKQIDGSFRTQAAVEGIMGLSRESQSNLDQVIGFALPLGNCDVGSIALGGIDNRFIKGPLYSLSMSNASKSMHSMRINAAYVGGKPVNVTAIDSILDTKSDRISLGKASGDFFRLLNATKSLEGWKVPNPVDISFDITLNDNQIVQLTLSNNTICDGNIGSVKDCISIFDDGSGPLNTWTFGTSFLQPPQPLQTPKPSQSATQSPAAVQSTVQPTTQQSVVQSSATQLTTQLLTTQFNTTQLLTTQFNTTQLTTTQYNTTQLSTTQYNTTQFNTTQLSTTQFNTIQFKTQLFTVQPNTTQSTIIPTITNFINPEIVVIDLRPFPMEIVRLD
ncbi:2780_t:CDS:2 [Racocetra persica]|uniref:2780_t:CDS:1 n=1 Tax=Racocetra persica TaxID=160502 RepID=A0ACA9KMU4_9GLOM|nr:2780_t:CDS:2 [Racocetra persica]